MCVCVCAVKTEIELIGMLFEIWIDDGLSIIINSKSNLPPMMKFVNYECAQNVSIKQYKCDWMNPKRVSISIKWIKCHVTNHSE